MSISFHEGVNKFLFKTIFIALVIILASCSQEEDPEENKDTGPIGSAVLNNAYTSFSRSSFFVSDVFGGLYNSVSLFRTDNSQITLEFAGQEEGLREIAPGDSSIRKIEYKDSGSKIYRADSGSIFINSYKFRDGFFYISGGFAFRAITAPVILPDGTPFFSTVRVTDGAFVNLRSAD